MYTTYIIECNKRPFEGLVLAAARKVEHHRPPRLLDLDYKGLPRLPSGVLGTNRCHVDTLSSSCTMGAVCATKGLLPGFRRASKRRVAFHELIIRNRVSGDLGATGSLLDLYSLQPQPLPEGVHVLYGRHRGTRRLCDEEKWDYSCWWALQHDLDAFSSRREARRRRTDTKTHHAFVRSAGLQHMSREQSDQSPVLSSTWKTAISVSPRP